MRTKKSKVPSAWTAPQAPPKSWAANPLFRYFSALLAVALVCALRAALDPILGSTQPFSLFFAPVLLMGWWAGTGPAVLAALLGWLVGDWFFLAPRYTLFTIGTHDLTTALIHLSICGGIILVTHRLRLARTQADQSERRFRLFMDHSPVLAWVKDEQGRYVYLNKAYEERFGLTLDQCSAKTDDQLWPAETAARLRQADQTALAADHPIQVAEETTERNGSQSIWLNTKFSLWDPAGHRLLASIGLDITPLKQAEQALRRSEAIYHAMARSIPGGAMSVVDQDLRYIVAEGALLPQLGLSQEALQGHTVEEAFDPETGRLRAEHFLRALAGEVTSYETSYHGRIIWSQFVPLRADDKRVMAAMSLTIDITERKQAERALKTAKDQLAIANTSLEKKVRERTAKLQETLADLEHMSYSMVHDMRAPLRAMHGFATLAERDCAGSSQHRTREYLRLIREAAARLDSFITDALNYNQMLLQQLPTHPTDLAALLRGLQDTYPNLHPTHADIFLEFDRLLVLANESLLTQCFGNLLSNAVKFVAPGVRPRVHIRAETAVSTDASPSPRSSATVEDGRHTHEAPCLLNHQLVRVWVEDNGIGIPKDAHQKVFRMFQRLHHPDQYPGTGIGLAIARKAVERMGGRIGFESEPGCGTRFWVDLPRA